MSTQNKADAFLRAMNPEPAPAPEVVEPKLPKRAPPAKPAATPAMNTRAGLKHIGGYFDRDGVEKVAVLRARLALDNSELLKLAIDDLYRKHMAKRAFGDS